LGEILLGKASGNGGKQRHSDWEGGAVTKKETSKSRRQSGLTRESLLKAQSTAKSESFRSALSRARFNKAIGKLADKAFATKSPRVKAAHDEARMHLTNAWKSEFQQALARAATYLPSTKPVTREDKRALADFLKPLKKLLKGRSRGMGPRLFAMAERAAAHRVRERLKLFREKDGRKRISSKSGIHRKLIAEAIPEVSTQFNVPPAKVSADNIFKLLNKK
jgi:hypothetical protein